MLKTLNCGFFFSMTLRNAVGSHTSCLLCSLLSSIMSMRGPWKICKCIVPLIQLACRDGASSTDLIVLNNVVFIRVLSIVYAWLCRLSTVKTHKSVKAMRNLCKGNCGGRTTRSKPRYPGRRKRWRDSPGLRSSVLDARIWEVIGKCGQGPCVAIRKHKVAG